MFNTFSDEAFINAIEAHKSRDYENARKFYEKVLFSIPNHPDANHNLGLLEVDSGSYHKAIDCFKRAVDANPLSAQFWKSLLNLLEKTHNTDELKKFETLAKASGMHRSEGEIIFSKQNDYVDPVSDFVKTELRKIYKKKDFPLILSLEKNYLPKYESSVWVLNFFGSVYLQLGKSDEAVNFLTKAHLVNPLDTNVLLNLSTAQFNLKDFHASISSLEKVLNIKPNSAEALNGLGNAFIELKKVDFAEDLYKKALEVNPDNHHSYNNLGNLYKDNNRVDEAIALYRKAIAVCPNVIEPYCNLSDAFYKDKKPKEALNILNDALKVSESAVIYQKLGILHTLLGDIHESIKNYEKGLEINPLDADAHCNLGNSYKRVGNFKGALASYKKAIKIKPSFCAAHRHFSTLHKYSKTDLANFQQMIHLNSVVLSSLEEKAHIEFGLAKAFKDLGDFENSYRYFVDGNRSRNEAQTYDIENDIKFLDTLVIKSKVADQFKLEIKNHKTPIPVFIVGMPRSGTTLLEQMISSHTEVTGLGELSYVAEACFEMARGGTDINEQKIQNFRDYYFDKITQHDVKTKFFVDKMPHNFLYIPFILSAFPEAKIIHIKRDSKATCWSNFTQHFSADGLGYCWDLENVVTYYNGYSKLMNYYRNRYSDSLINVNYEALTESPDIHLSKVLLYIGLEWEDKCIRPEENKGVVSTASNKQVRQGIYKGSSMAWKKFEKYLEEPLSKLNA